MPPVIAAMERQHISGRRHLIVFDSFTPQGGADQCFALRMGASMAVQSSEGALECTGEHISARALCYISVLPYLRGRHVLV